MGGQTGGSTPSSSSSVSTPGPGPFGSTYAPGVGPNASTNNAMQMATHAPMMGIGAGFGGMNQQSMDNQAAGMDMVNQNFNPAPMPFQQQGYVHQQPMQRMNRMMMHQNMNAWNGQQQWAQQAMAMQRMQRMGMPHPSQNTGFVPPSTQQEQPQPALDQGNQVNYSWSK